MKMKRYLLILILFIVSACSTHSIVKDTPQTIKGITVTPTLIWNKVPSTLAVGGVPTWTADGISLNSISFFSDIKDGKSLVKATKKQQFPTFRADMLPTELIELIESTLAKAYQAKILNQGELAPLMLGTDDAFEYTFDFVTGDELPRRGYVVGAVKNEKLHVIFYQAARLHYYDSRVADVKSIVNTAVIEN
jgi:hypothetical protein